MEKLKQQKVLKVMLLVIVVVILGTATKLKTTRNIALSGAISGNASFDGSGDIVINTENNNFSLIEHTISVGARSTSEDFLNFPSGFTRDNCMVVSWSTEEVHTSYSDINFNGSIVNDHYDAKLFFYYGSSPTIRIKVDNTQQSYNTEVKFRILLMKI